MGTKRIHSEIADLLKEAEQELNTDQMKWDRFLVHSFFNSPSMRTYRVVYQFQELHNLSDEHFFALKRVPSPFVMHMRVQFSRFVSAHLPTIAQVLWDQKKENADKIALAINKSNVDTRKNPADKQSMADDKRVIRSGIYADVKSSKLNKTFRNAWDSYNRNNQWGVTK